MRKKTILLILGAMVVLFVAMVIGVALQPATFTVSRSAVIAAPASGIFPHVNELKRWEEWSPWMKMDPKMANSYEGPAGGQGAMMTWNGNMQAGAGRVTITQSRTNELVHVHLDFFKPMAGQAEAEFTFTQSGDEKAPMTEVVWTMNGTNNFVAKAMGLAMNMDKMIGGAFAMGLENLKNEVEHGSH